MRKHLFQDNKEGKKLEK